MSKTIATGSGRIVFKDEHYNVWEPNPFDFIPDTGSIPTYDGDIEEQNRIKTLGEIWTYNYWIEQSYEPPEDSDLYIYFNPKKFNPSEFILDGTPISSQGEINLNLYKKPKFPIIPKKGDIIISSPNNREIIYSKIINILIPEEENKFILDIEINPVKHKIFDEEIITGDYFDNIPHYKFLHRRTNFVDNKVILNQPTAVYDKIEGIETSPEKFGYLIPDDLSPIQKENLSIILNILRDKSVLKSNQKEGGMGSVYL